MWWQTVYDGDNNYCCQAKILNDVTGTDSDMRNDIGYIAYPAGIKYPSNWIHWKERWLDMLVLAGQILKD